MNDSKVNLNVNYSVIITFIILGWLLYHIITIQRSPLPNFDESFFASMTKSLQEQKRLKLEMSTLPQHQENEIWLYGPIYFYIQSWITNLVGWGIWQFRILNLISGIFTVFFTFLISKKIKLEPSHSILFLFTLLLDVDLNISMHSGRMDSLAMAFYLFGLYVLYFGRSISWISNIFGSILLSLALLTTPRIGFLFLVLPIGFFLEIFFTSRSEAKNRSEIYGLFLKYFISFTIISVPFFLWIYFKAGSLKNYVSEFSTNSTLNSFINFFNVPKFYLIPATILYIVFLVLIIYLNSDQAKKSNSELTKMSSFFLILFAPIIYLIFIKGGYYVYYTPLLYLSIYILFKIISNSTSFYKSLSIKAIYLLSFLNLVIFTFKLFYLIEYWDYRNPERFNVFFESKNVSGKNILASHPYFYAISKANVFLDNDDNRLIDKNKVDSLEIQHAFITKDKFKSDITFFQELGFAVSDSLVIIKTESYFLKNILSKLPLDLRSTYEGYHLTRIDCNDQLQ